LKVKQILQDAKDKAKITLAIAIIVVLFLSYIIWIDIQSAIEDYKK
jgi:hypothetical protein